MTALTVIVGTVFLTVVIMVFISSIARSITDWLVRS